MKRWIVPVVAVATIGAHEVASACSMANQVLETPWFLPTNVGPMPLLMGGDDAELRDGDGNAVALEVVMRDVVFRETLASLSEPIDVGCLGTIDSDHAEPDGTSPQHDDEGCGSGPVGSLTLLGLLTFWCRS